MASPWRGDGALNSVHTHAPTQVAHVIARKKEAPSIGQAGKEQSIWPGAMLLTRIAKPLLAARARAIGATEYLSAILPIIFASAVSTLKCRGVDRAFKTVKNVGPLWKSSGL